ncbi:MAG TPA: helix-turn-helix domain-containing protein [Ferruginibacter sp.]|jgi:excisionase family DNA binding protein|nr:helix-turn-helix domain-containing protein [Ferruginibacter sp.]
MKPYLLLNISLEEFENISRKIIQEEICKYIALKEEPLCDSIELLSKKDAARLLGISTVTITKYVRSGIIPASKLGARYKFDKNKILGSIQKIRNRA